MEKNTLMNKDYFEKVAEYVMTKTGLEAEGEDLLLTFKAMLEHAAKTLGEEKSDVDGEIVSLELPGYLTISVSKRDGNFGMQIVAQEELKKRIKDDSLLSDDDDEE